MLGRLACVLALLATPAFADTWIRVSSPTVEVFTDSSEKTARSVLKRFETLRRVFDDRSRAADVAVPARVFIFAAMRDFMDYEIDRSAAGFYQSSGGRDLIVAFEDTALKRTASHEYLHMVVRHSSVSLPSWFDEGMAEFYSTIAVNGPNMRVGQTIPGHLTSLAGKHWLSAEELASGNRADGALFYAESWALVHMLTLSPNWSAGMPKFVQLLNDGVTPADAFSTAFGKTMDNALRALRPYLRNPRTIAMPAPPAAEPETYQVTRLSSLDTNLALADLALSTRRGSVARGLFIKAAKSNPQSPAAIAGLGYLALAEDRKEDARREFERAIATGSRDASVYFELAGLNNDTAMLQKALSIDPQFVAAHFLLGIRLTDSGDYHAAIEHLHQTVAIEPRNFSYWHALGYAQAKSGDRQGAAESARRAAIIATTPDQEEMAAALSLLASEPPAPRSNKPAVTVPPSWQNRKGDQRVEGTLTSVNCESSPVRLTISTSGKTIDLKVKDPSAVELLNAEGASTTLACGGQSRPVAVEYVGTTMEVTRIEFRQVIIKR